MVSSPNLFTTFFISSIIYLLTLRFLVLRFVPSVTRKENIDEDEQIDNITDEVDVENLEEKQITDETIKEENEISDYIFY